jgi:hypothetical protein
VKTYAADEQNRDAPLSIRQRINPHHPPYLPVAIRWGARIRAGHIQMQVNVVRGTIRCEIKPVSRGVYSRPDFFGYVCGLIVGLQVGSQRHFRSPRSAPLLAYRGSCLDSRLNQPRIKPAHTPPLKTIPPRNLVLRTASPQPRPTLFRKQSNAHLTGRIMRNLRVGSIRSNGLPCNRETLSQNCPRFCRRDGNHLGGLAGLGLG